MISARPRAAALRPSFRTPWTACLVTFAGILAITRCASGGGCRSDAECAPNAVCDTTTRTCRPVGSDAGDDAGSPGLDAGDDAGLPGEDAGEDAGSDAGRDGGGGASDGGGGCRRAGVACALDTQCCSQYCYLGYCS